MNATRSKSGICAPLVLMGLALALCGPVPARAADAWEMRVCSDPYAFPASSRDREGFENRIARLIAEELGADLIHVWTVLSGDTVSRNLLRGECDVVMAVRDGAMNLLSTVPYYRSPFVFVYRKDRGLDLHSLDDPALRRARITTYPNSAPHKSLTSRGLEGNMVFLQPLEGPAGPDYDTPILRAVLAGEVDVAILYGPKAGYTAKHEAPELVVAPVSPEIEPPLIEMYRTWTIGVRPGDEAFRDRLDAVLARRWDDIQTIFKEYGVPLLPLPRPTLTFPTQ